MKTAWIIGALAAATLAAVIIGAGRTDQGAPGEIVVLDEAIPGAFPASQREPAPDLRLPDLQGNSVGLSDYRGQVVFLSFWATWCGPCRVEAPALQRLYERLAGEDFEILAVSLDAEQDVIPRFAAQYNLRFPMLWDQDGEAARAYAVGAVPLSLVLDRRGRIVFRLSGAREWDSEYWTQIIEAVLAEEA